MPGRGRRDSCPWGRSARRAVGRGAGLIWDDPDGLDRAACDREPGPSPTVALATSTAGFDARGTVIRSDGVSLPFRPVREPRLPERPGLIREDPRTGSSGGDHREVRPPHPGGPGRRPGEPAPSRRSATSGSRAGRSSRRRTTRTRGPRGRSTRRGYVVMPGGVDVHCHIAGSKVNAARAMRPEEHEGKAFGDAAGMRSGTVGSTPSTFATGYLYAGLGYTTALDASIPPLGGEARASRVRRHAADRQGVPRPDGEQPFPDGPDQGGPGRQGPRRRRLAARRGEGVRGEGGQPGRRRALEARGRATSSRSTTRSSLSA